MKLLMENYKAVNARLGLPENTQTFNPVHISGRKITVFSSDPLESDVAPMNIAVSSIAHLNALIGMPDDSDDSQIQYPPRLSELLGEKYQGTHLIRPFLHALTTEDREYLKMATEAYLMGNSGKVKEYEPLINAAGFPGKIAYFASSHDIELSGEVIVQGEDPVVWNFGRMVMKPHAALTVQAPLIVSASELVGASSAQSPNTITIHPPDLAYHALKGVDGMTGMEGTETGGNGAHGTAGSGGMKGLPQPPFNMDIHGSISGFLQIGARGGTGQNGGQGGAGGTGGNGRIQGNGGDGGKGGKSGDGGNCAPVRISCTSLNGKIENIRLKALPGIPGAGGKGGAGHLNGKDGDAGEAGKPGAEAHITVISAVLRS